MIIELLFSPIFILLEIIIAMLPSTMSLPSWSFETVSLIGKGMMFFPSDVWVFVIGNVLFWITAQFAWAIIEWVYKKIPGVD